MCRRNIVVICFWRWYPLFVWLILGLGISVHAQDSKKDREYGLSFASHEVTKDQRTALNLTPAEPFTITDDFEIRFDLSFKRLTDAYGYVLRIIANDSLNFDLVSSPEHDDFHDLNFIVNNAQTNIFFDHQDIGLRPLVWTSVVIKFEASRNTISVLWDGKTKSHVVPIDKLKTFRFFFGANEFAQFNTSDAPPMILRDIEVHKVNGTPVKWDLDRHGTNEVSDNSDTYIASVKNPSWLIDNHVQWKHRKKYSIGKYPSIAFNPQKEELYTIDKSNLYVFNIPSSAFERIAVRKGNPVYSDANQLLYVPETGKLVNYDLQSNVLAEFDFVRQSWSNADTTYYEPRYWHNNKFYNPTDSSVYVFGGYGFFSYKNTFSKYSETDKKWVEVKPVGFIPPRYLAASAHLPAKNAVLIFGGYGSESGKQELFPQNFHDLYSFDLKSHEVKKLLEYKNHTEEDIVFSNSMVVNEQDSCFYVLCFPKNKHDGFIKLRRYSLEVPEYTTLPDSIPFRFHDEHSFCDLFLSKGSNELIAVTSHKDNGQYQVNVYSINYPPLDLPDIAQTIPGQSQAGLYFLIIGGGLVIGLAAYFLLKRKRNNQAKKVLFYPEGSETNAPDGVTAIRSFAETEKVASSISLLGGFQVFDKNGNDITGKFTMTLKELFVLILLHASKFEKGISTSLLHEHLWPDKDDLSARNNRNVNLKKLRSLLEEIGDISIVNSNAYLQLVITPDVVCDYTIVTRILANPNALDNNTLNILLSYVKKGNLLPNMQNAWLDSFKSDISNRVIDFLIEYARKLDSSKDDRILLEIADTIFHYDSINQEALVIKCSVLNKKGKYSLAKTWYDHFVKEYETLYAENYPKTFEEVIS
jgi:hypothetical protein